MNRARTIRFKLGLAGAIVMALALGGCAESDPPYGVEARLEFAGKTRQIWAVAPSINLSGYGSVDPLLQADIVYEQLQQVQGLTIIPVNRVAEVYESLKIEKVESPEQANLVCDLLGCDGLIVPTITAYDPYVPPKVGASLQLFTKPRDYARPGQIDPRDLARQATPGNAESLVSQPPPGNVIQAVGMFDAANGSVREAVNAYATGRNDPVGPMGAKEYLASIDRYCGFVYHELIVQVVNRAAAKQK